MVKKGSEISEDREAEKASKEELNESLNRRISHFCLMTALIISVVAFATTILDAYDERFVILGLSLAVALLAIAGLQNHVKPKK